MILYVSESGGMVTKEYEGTPYEEADNLVVAKIIADAWGCTVALLGRATTMYTKSADAAIYWRGKTDAQLWEIKTNRAGTKRSIENALRKANRQAECVFLHIISEMAEANVMDAIKGQIRYTHLQKIAIIRESTIKVCARQDILAMLH